MNEKKTKEFQAKPVTSQRNPIKLIIEWILPPDKLKVVTSTKQTFVNESDEIKEEV